MRTTLAIQARQQAAGDALRDLVSLGLPPAAWHLPLHPGRSTLKGGGTLGVVADLEGKVEPGGTLEQRLHALASYAHVLAAPAVLHRYLRVGQLLIPAWRGELRVCVWTYLSGVDLDEIDAGGHARLLGTRGACQHCVRPMYTLGAAGDLPAHCPSWTHP